MWENPMVILPFPKNSGKLGLHSTPKLEGNMDITLKNYSGDCKKYLGSNIPSWDDDQDLAYWLINN